MAQHKKENSLVHLLTKEKMIEESQTLSWRAIATKYNCSTKSVLKLRNDYGLEVKKRKHMDDNLKLRPKSELYIAYGNLDLSFFPQEVADVKELWNAGIHFTDMVVKMKRNYLEILALVTDLIDKGRLQPRKNGVLGEG